MEVLVVILISTLILAMVGGTMVFLTTTTGNLIQQSEEIEMAKNISNYFRNLYEKGNHTLDYNLNFDKNTGSIYYETEKIIFSNTGLTHFEISPDKDKVFIKCYMTFQSGNKFEYIVGLYEVQTDD